MDFIVSFFLFLPLAGLLETALQESDGGSSWGWILLILLILALLIGWWLLGPGARRRRSSLADLPRARGGKSAPPTVEPEAIAAVPAPGAGLLSEPQDLPPVVPESEMADEPVADGEDGGIPYTPANVSGIPSDGMQVEAETTDESSPDGEEPLALQDEPESAPAPSDAPTPPPAPAPPAEPDNLRRIEGIGPKVAGILNGAGIATFGQLADTSVEQLREILEAEGLKFMKPDTWPEQAQLAATGDWAGLQNLQDQLKGGRRIGE